MDSTKKKRVWNDVTNYLKDPSSGSSVRFEAQVYDAFVAVHRLFDAFRSSPDIVAELEKTKDFLGEMLDCIESNVWSD